MHVAATTLGLYRVRLAQSLDAMDRTALVFLTQAAPRPQRAAGRAILGVNAPDLLQKTNAIEGTRARVTPLPRVPAAGRAAQQARVDSHDGKFTRHPLSRGGLFVPVDGSREMVTPFLLDTAIRHSE